MPELPNELVLEILKLAAHSRSHQERATAGNLALVSSAVYKLVCPVLYHTLVITTANVGRLADMGTIKRILPYVQFIYAHRDMDDDDRESELCFLNATFQILSSWEPSSRNSLLDTGTLIAGECFRVGGLLAIRHLSVKDHLLDGMLFGLPYMQQALARSGNHDVLREMARLSIQFPVRRNSVITAMPATTWADIVLGTVPNLTHFAIQFAAWTSDDSPAEQAIFTTGYEDLAEFLKHFLDACSRTLEEVRVYVAGVYATAEGKERALRLVQELKDPRLIVWVEHRPSITEIDAARLSLDDAWGQRNIWSNSLDREMWTMHGRVVYA